MADLDRLLLLERHEEVKNLAGSMVRAMKNAYGSKPNDILAAIGPSIGSCCYEVGEPVISAVNDSFPNAESLLISPPDSRREYCPGNGADRIRGHRGASRDAQTGDGCSVTF